MTYYWHKVSVTHAAKVARDKGVWSGLISQCNVNPWHLDHGWCLGMPVTVHGNELPLTTLKEIKQNFEYYNHEAELGRRSSLWEKVYLGA